MNTTTLNAPTMKCGGCANSVRNVLSRQPGVSDVQVELPTKRVTVTYDDGATSPQRLAEVLTNAGFPSDTTAGPATK